MKKLISFMLIITLLLSLSCVYNAQSSDSVKVNKTQYDTFEDEFIKVDENDRLALYANGKTGVIKLFDKIKNIDILSNPSINDETLTPSQKKLLSSQIEILYYDKKNVDQERNSQIASIQKNGYSAKISNKEFIATYDFPEDFIKVTVKYSLGIDYLKVSVPINEITEKEGNRLIEVSVLPYFNSGNLTDNGFIFIPDGCGSIIKMNNSKQNGSAIKEPLYGEDKVVSADKMETNKENMLLNMIGIETNGNSVIAVADSGSAASYVNAYTSNMKKLYNTAYFSFEYRSTDKYILDSTNKNAKKVKVISEKIIPIKSYDVRYYPVNENNGYVGMANKYREYLKERDSFKKSKAKDNAPYLVNSYGAIEKRGTKFYIPVNEIIPLTTFKECQKITDCLTDNGIKNIIMSYNGFQSGGVTGKLQTKGKLEKVLGSKSDFKDLISNMKKNNIEFLPNLNMVKLYKGGNGFSKNNSSASTINGTPGIQYKYDLFSGLKNKDIKPYYLVSPIKYESIVDKFVKSYKYDFSGIALNDIGGFLYSDNDKKTVQRIDSINYIQNAFEKLNDNYSTVLSFNTNDYLFNLSTYISDIPMTDSEYDITDYSVPFLQILLSGYRPYFSKSVNLSSDEHLTFLKAIETGTFLSYTFNYQNFLKCEKTHLDYIYNSNYKDWLKSSKEYYNKINSVYQKTKGCSIIEHKELASGVYFTKYENNTSIIVNYNDTEYQNQDFNVKSKDYLIIQ